MNPEAPGPGGFVKVWAAGARPRTLGAAVAPVLVGTAAGASGDGLVVWRAGGALVVALALQIGVNYANDYSDGVRGTDDQRVGPIRLVAGGLARAAAVRRAAGLAFVVAAVAGLALALAVDLRLVFVGAAAIAAAVLYTGGPRPYGYRGWGEVSVLVFFGLVATAGSAYVQHGAVSPVAIAAAGPVGLLACALLLVNNVRDIDTDRQAGKRTLAVRVGAPVARRLYVAAIAVAFLGVAALGVARPWVLVALAALPLATTPARAVLAGGPPPTLIPALMGTARLHLAVGVLLAAGLWVS